MFKRKHTPGPWILTDNGDATVITAMSGSCELHIADVTGSLQLFNAHLIASAPDLLENLESLFEIAIQQDAIAEDGFLANEIKACIEKAKGVHHA